MNITSGIECEIITQKSAFLKHSSFLIFTVSFVILCVTGIIINSFVAYIIWTLDRTQYRNAYYYLGCVCILSVIFCFIAFSKPIINSMLHRQTLFDSCWVMCILLRLQSITFQTLTHLDGWLKVCLLWDRYWCVIYSLEVRRIRKTWTYKAVPWISGSLFMALSIPSYKVINIQYCTRNATKCLVKMKLNSTFMGGWLLMNTYLQLIPLSLVMILLILTIIRLKRMRSISCLGDGNQGFNTNDKDSINPLFIPAQNKQGPPNITNISLLVATMALRTLPYNDGVKDMVQRTMLNIQRRNRVLTKFYSLLSLLLGYMILICPIIIYNISYGTHCMKLFSKGQRCRYTGSISLLGVLAEISEYTLFTFGLIVIDDNLKTRAYYYLKRWCK